MAIFPQNAIIPAQNPYPAALIVPAGMTDTQFRFGLNKAGVYWYETEVYRTVRGYITHVGFLWTGLAMDRKGENVVDGGDPGDVTPSIITRSFAWAETAPVVVLVDMEPSPVYDIFTKFFGDMMSGVIGNIPVIGWIIDSFSDEKYEPVRWLPNTESVGPNTIHIAWVYWGGSSPSEAEVESRLGELDVTVLSTPLRPYASYKKIPFYTGGAGAVVQLTLAIPGRAVPILQIAKAISATDIRVSTAAMSTSMVSVDVGIEKLSDTLFAITASTAAIVGAVASTAGAAAGVAGDLLGNAKKVEFYLKVALGVALGVAGVWAISQIVSITRGGRASSPLDFSDIGGGRAGRRVKSKFRRGSRRTKPRASRPGRAASQPAGLPPYRG